MARANVEGCDWSSGLPRSSARLFPAKLAKMAVRWCFSRQGAVSLVWGRSTGRAAEQVFRFCRWLLLFIGRENGTIGQQWGLDVQSSPGPLSKAQHGRNLGLRRLEVIPVNPTELHSWGNNNFFTSKQNRTPKKQIEKPSRRFLFRLFCRLFIFSLAFWKVWATFWRGFWSDFGPRTETGTSVTEHGRCSRTWTRFGCHQASSSASDPTLVWIFAARIGALFWFYHQVFILIASGGASAINPNSFCFLPPNWLLSHFWHTLALIARVLVSK